MIRLEEMQSIHLLCASYKETYGEHALSAHGHTAPFLRLNLWLRVASSSPRLRRLLLMHIRDHYDYSLHMSRRTPTHE